MAFEFFFGLFGLISTDSKSRHKSRLQNEWRLSTPLNPNLFRDSGLKVPLLVPDSPPSAKFKGSSDDSAARQGPVFSTTGTLGAASAAGPGKPTESSDKQTASTCS